MGSDLVEGLVIDVSHCSRESCESEARRVVGEFLKCLADEIRDERPQFNPDHGIWDDVAGYIEGLGQ